MVLNQGLERRYARKAHIQDILDLFMNVQDNEPKLPKFVADAYNAMSFTSAYDVIGSLISKLSNEIV